MKKKILTAGLAFACAAALFLPVKADETETGFSRILEENGIHVEGHTEPLSFDALEGLLLEVDTEYSQVWEKYKAILSGGESVVLSPEEILELHYYRLSHAEQSMFLARAKNQKVNIDMNQEEVILISYNPNF